MTLLGAPSILIAYGNEPLGFLRRGKGGLTRTMTWNNGPAQDEPVRLITTSGGVMNRYGAPLSAGGIGWVVTVVRVGIVARVVTLTVTDSGVLPQPASKGT